VLGISKGEVFESIQSSCIHIEALHKIILNDKHIYKMEICMFIISQKATKR